MKKYLLIASAFILLFISQQTLAQTGIIMFTDTFYYGQTASSQCNAWNTFRSQLTPRCYTKITIKGTNDMTGQSCSDLTIASNYANALNTLTDYMSPSCNGNVWELCFRYSGEVWLNPPSLCSGANCPNPGYILRPCISNQNWGGVNTPTCNAPSQRMTIIFEYDSTLGTINNILGPDTVCNGDTVQFQCNWVTGATNYLWTVPNGSSVVAGQGTKSVSVVFGSSSGNIDLKAENACDSTFASLSIVVGIHPQVTLNNDTFLCRGDSIPISAAGADFYSWTPASGLSCSNCSSPLTSPDSTTTYVLESSDSVGCLSFDSITITVINLVADAGPDTILCLGDSMQLNASGGSNYSWNPSTGLTCSNCPDPIAFPDTSTYYVLTVSDSFGCTAFDTLYIEVVECPGMNEFNADNHIIAIPNPSDGNILIRVLGEDFIHSTISIFSLKGQVVYRYQVNESGDKQIDLRSYAKGVYYLKADNENEVLIRKIILQ